MPKPETESKKTCFIIMPITVAEICIPNYRDKEEHFKHVLECLLIPAVEKAGFIAIRPVAKGADLIHAGIINHLETANIILCDMSTLNPNVFFECGIRISLNKPVCLIKDNFTPKIPFDTAVVNYHEYKSSLEPWELASEIDILSKHIQDSYERSNGRNSLWKYFGFRSEAVPVKGEYSEADKLNYLSNKIDDLSNKLNESIFVPQYTATSTPLYASTSGRAFIQTDSKAMVSPPDIKNIFAIVEKFLRNQEVDFTNIAFLDNELSITIRKKINETQMRTIEKVITSEIPAIKKVSFKYIYT